VRQHGNIEALQMSTNTVKYASKTFPSRVSFRQNDRKDAMHCDRDVSPLKVPINSFNPLKLMKSFTLCYPLVCSTLRQEQEECPCAIPFHGLLLQTDHVFEQSLVTRNHDIWWDLDSWW